MDRLTSLPAELLDIIIDKLDSVAPACSRDLINLSTVDRRLRIQITPLLFRTIKLRHEHENPPDEEDEDEVDAAGNRICPSCETAHPAAITDAQFALALRSAPDRRELIRRLNIIIAVEPPDLWNNDGGESNEQIDDESRFIPSDQSILPCDVVDVLSNLRDFPKLRDISLEFDLGELEGTVMDRYMFVAEDSFTPGHVRRAEQRWVYRAVMAATYAALASNTDSTVRGLEIRKFVPVAVSVWEDKAEWHAFLGGMNAFTLQIAGFYDGGQGHDSCINETEAYANVLGRLDGWFFDHLTDLEEFRLEGDPMLPAGLNRDTAVEIPLSSAKMVGLRCVHLENVLVSPMLCDFLANHGGSIRRLVMRGCHANNAIHWGDFFDELARSGMPALIALDFMPSTVIELARASSAEQEEREEKWNFRPRQWIKHAFIDGYPRHYDEYNLEDLLTGSDEGDRHFDDEEGKEMVEEMRAIAQEAHLNGRIAFLYSAIGQESTQFRFCAPNIIERSRNGADWRMFQQLSDIIRMNRIPDTKRQVR